MTNPPPECPQAERELTDDEVDAAISAALNAIDDRGLEGWSDRAIFRAGWQAATAAAGVPREAETLRYESSHPDSAELRCRQAERITELEAALAGVPREDARVLALQSVIEWALGEGDAFPNWPETVTITGNPKYWWRKELRERYDRAIADARGRT